MTKVNRLAKETSPYLQQHKFNTVDWWPYSDEAFELARKENKPVFISIGYSTCHWCHVMARESFSDEETGKYMNEHFINIKIDREEYPGVDRMYQDMYQLMYQRGGGWPLSVYAFPDKRPFFIGTYFPKEQKFGLNSFMNINKQIMEAWNEKQTLLIEQADNLDVGVLRLNSYQMRDPGEINKEHYEKELEGLTKRLDHNYGGIRGSPKFPRVATLRFLLNQGILGNKKDLVDFVRFSFHKMAKGGIYDQLGGGFARYSVDERWEVPHFEKMLYDNAGLLKLGAELYAATGDSYIKWVVYDLFAWIVRDMLRPDKAFHSAINAESEGQEGKFYIWTAEEVRNILEQRYEFASYYFGITEEGNFKDPHNEDLKGLNVLQIKHSIKETAEKFDMDEDEAVGMINSCRQLLFMERSKREPPSIDTKVLTQWNAYMIKSLYIAGEMTGLESATKLANDALKFLLNTLLKEDKLLHSYHVATEDQISREVEGIFDDYAYMIAALISAFEHNDSWEYMLHARKLQEIADDLFFNEEKTVYHMNPRTSDGVLGKILQATDDSMPSGQSVMVDNLFKLSKYLEKPELEERAHAIANNFTGMFGTSIGAMSEMLLSAQYFINYPAELVMVDTQGDELNSMHYRLYLPHRLIYRWNEETRDDGRLEWEVLEGRSTAERPTAYICKGQTCTLPLTDAESAKKAIIAGILDELET